MRILLDECLPRRLKRDLVGHDVFLTVDRKLQHQQNLASFNIAVIIMLLGPTVSSICNR